MPHGKFISANQKHNPDLGRDALSDEYGISALISQTSFGGENSDSVGDRRAASCESFMCTLRPSNPVFGLAMSGRVTTVHSYSLRSCRNYNNKMCKTKRLSEFVSVKYLDFLS